MFKLTFKIQRQKYTILSSKCRLEYPQVHKNSRQPLHHKSKENIGYYSYGINTKDCFFGTEKFIRILLNSTTWVRHDV